MPQVERKIVKARAARLRERAASRRSAWLDALIGSRQQVLVETELGHGHGTSNAPVRLAGLAKGTVTDATIVGREGDHLIGICE
jgi:threonylcarbamoyladenosine tRNA methylthiotransferase MtaB